MVVEIVSATGKPVNSKYLASVEDDSHGELCLPENPREQRRGFTPRFPHVHTFASLRIVIVPATYHISFDSGSTHMQHVTAHGRPYIKVIRSHKRVLQL